MAAERPLIGLNCRYETHQEYPTLDRLWIYAGCYRALLLAGAVPVIVPPLDTRSLVSQCLDRVDGIVFVGGLDIPPAAYHQESHPETEECHPNRFASDKLLAELVLQTDIPVLGICMGQQLINVVYGGTLTQHIETDVRHSRIKPTEEIFHPITVEEDSLLHRILGVRELEVNSSHHQAVDKPAPGLRVLARAPDGIIEAMQMTDRSFFLTVQWHPERLTERPEQRKLLRAFVTACSEARARSSSAT